MNTRYFSLFAMLLSMIVVGLLSSAEAQVTSADSQPIAAATAAAPKRPSATSVKKPSPIAIDAHKPPLSSTTQAPRISRPSLLHRAPGQGSGLSATGSITFTQSVDYSVGAYPRSLVLADFDGDARQDFAVANESGNVVVRRNVGTSFGSFAFEFTASYLVGARPAALAVGDLNGDGRPDLVTANSGSNNVSVLLNSGNGTFNSAIHYAAGSDPRSVAIGDMNSDGSLDLVVANWGSPSVSILYNSGSGVFSSTANFPMTGQALAVAVGDFNVDGKPDLSVAYGSADGGRMEVWLNMGSGIFASPVAYPTSGTDPISIAVGDYNGDGTPDLAVANFMLGSVAVLLNNGDGTFGTTTTYTVGSTPSSVTCGDVNGDGNLELVVANSGSGTVSVLTNNGNGTFTANTYNTYMQGLTGVALGDLDGGGDGHLDIAVTSYPQGWLSLLQNLGNGTFTSYGSWSVGSRPDSVVTADFNRDGKTDLAWGNAEYESNSVMLNDGNGGFEVPTNYSGYGTKAAIGDFNSDAAPDLFNGWAVLLNKGDGTLGTPVAPYVGAVSPSVAVADFNGDGKTDLLEISDPFVSPVNVLVFMNDGTGKFSAPAKYTVANYGWWLAAADFNGDGKPDLAVGSYQGTTLSILMNLGDGTFAPRVDYSVGAAQGPIAVGDLDGNGLADIVVPCASGLCVLLNTGGGTFSAPIAYATNDYAGAPALADFTGDGKLDIVATTYSGIELLLNDGFGAFTVDSRITIDATGHSSVAVGDFNNDGKPDLAVTCASGVIHVLMNTSSYTVPAYSVTGRVVDSNGNPLSGVSIFDGSLHLGVTDSLGNYALSGIAAGTYTITPSKSGYDFSPSTRSLSVPPNADGQDFAGGTNTAWTLMFYLDGDNADIAADFPRIFHALESQATTPYVQVLALWEQSGVGNASYYKLNPSGTYTEGVDRLSKGDLDLASPATLVDFVNWARAQYPAQHYALILADHGSGLGGVMQDESNGNHMMTVSQLGAALASMRQSSGRPIDVLFMDACLMGMVEDAYQFRGSVDYYVASENILFGGVTAPYLRYVSGVQSASTPAQIAALFVNSYADQQSRLAQAYTISSGDLSKLNSLVVATDWLAFSLNNQMPLAAFTLLKVSASVQRFDDSEPHGTISLSDTYIDLYDFARLVKANFSDSNTQSAAQAVMDAVAMYVPSGSERHGSTTSMNLDHSHGVSIFFPAVGSSFYNANNYDFAVGADWSQGLAPQTRNPQDTINWGPMLVNYFRTTQPGGPDNPNPPPLVAWPTDRIYQFLPLIAR